jgi:hypothetical protein
VTALLAFTLPVRSSLVTAALIALVPSSTLGQAPAPAVPSAPHERLGFFEGTWTVAEAPPEQNFRETCAWLADGRRHMLCRSRWMTSTGPREGLSVISYSPATADYLYHGFRAGGAVVAHRGAPKDDGWQFTSEQGEGVARTMNRITITRLEGDDMQFTEESARGGGAWEVKAKLRYKRAEAVPSMEELRTKRGGHP